MDINISNGTLLSDKKNEIMLFAAIQLELEMIILSEISQRKTNITYKRNLKKYR